MIEIGISEDTIERLVQLSIQSKVNKWFDMPENKDVIRTLTREYVRAYVQCEIAKQNFNIREMAKEVQAESFAERLTSAIATEIASTFCDMYK